MYKIILLFILVIICKNLSTIKFNYLKCNSGLVFDFSFSFGNKCSFDLNLHFNSTSNLTSNPQFNLSSDLSSVSSSDLSYDLLSDSLFGSLSTLSSDLSFDQISYINSNFDFVKLTIDELELILKNNQQELFNHNLYQTITTKDDLKIFMESHVFAVWDFMCLVKKLQKELTSIDNIWIPKKYKYAGRMINEIILNEETDFINNNYTSHYELYKLAMGEINASSTYIDNFTKDLNYQNLEKKIVLLNSDIFIFVSETFNTIKTNNLPYIVGYFYYGRENPIPTMFGNVVKNICVDFDCVGMKLYLDKHIKMDSEEHGPMSIMMMNEIIDNDVIKKKYSLIGGIVATRTRINLWNFILEKIKNNK